MYSNMFTSSLLMWIAEVTALVCVLGFLLWKFMSRNDDYWEKRGVIYSPRMNAFTAVRAMKKKPFNEIILENQSKYGSVFGGFEGANPILHVADPDLLRDILVKDFNVFSNRREFKFGDPVTDNIVNFLTGEDWKRVRTIITPAFTSKRMRQMSSIINRCSKTVADMLEESSKTGKAVDFKQLFGAFSLDVIAASAFGTKIDAYNDPNNTFVEEAKKNFADLSTWKIIMFLTCPMWMVKYFGIRIFQGTDFFRDIVLNVIQKRKEQKKRYNDVLQIFMDAVDDETLSSNSDLNVDEEDRFGSIIDTEMQPQTHYKKLSQNELLAQCILFFFVGYETTASALTFMAYSLATNPEWQERLIEEVDSTFEKHSEMSYDSVRGMKILDAVLSETLRIYPFLQLTDRTATQDYKLGDTGITIKKGMIVMIPIYALHFDPKYFEDPEKFDPERFLDPSKSTFPQYAYLPFGAGPRNCLGMRFALLEIKLCITNILRRYRFRAHSTTQIPVKFRIGNQFSSVNEMPLVVEKRTDV